MPRRYGRPGLLGTVARTAVISGTASAVSHRVNRGMSERDMRRQAEAEAQAAPPPAPAPAPAPADRVAQLSALADLKAQGLLTDEEFAVEKARILGS
ncbi:SHOCT domain-containing protein [Streptomyces longispororuber]|uniref:SHOCT domain-containing protein n=1 Tax=Streptomyces longispororuber TaxID=68230 RepID=UPI00210B2A58|nr:SHOCT domain-containing protein [Streptomyces longispororuber]MCQ4209625.1 SHOCT domain-containing protein [Streptomyces longispororuber]